jgi:pyridoxal biosynthesis lyase PdxS
MTNPFAAKQSGMASMIENMLPADVREAINVAKTQLPTVVEHVQKQIQIINQKLDALHVKLDAITMQLSTVTQDVDNDVLVTEIQAQTRNGAKFPQA